MYYPLLENLDNFIRENGIAIGEDGLAVRIEEDGEIPNVNAETVDTDTGETVGMSARYSAEDSELEKETVQVQPENPTVFELDDGNNYRSAGLEEYNQQKQDAKETQAFTADIFEDASQYETIMKNNASIGITGSGQKEVMPYMVYNTEGKTWDNGTYYRVYYDNAVTWYSFDTFQPYKTIMSNGEYWFYDSSGTPTKG